MKVVSNNHDRIWFINEPPTYCTGIAEAMQEKLDEILQGYLEEQYAFEKADREFMGQ